MLSNLNSQQQKAVLAVDGPVMVCRSRKRKNQRHLHTELLI